MDNVLAEDELQEILGAWHSNLLYSKSLSANTVDSYATDIKILMDFLREYQQEDVKQRDLTEITRQDIRSWFLYRKNKNDSPKSIARGLSAIKSLLKFFIEQKLIEGHEILNMKPPKISKILPRPIQIGQINDILNSIDGIKKTKWIVKRDQALLTLVYSVGLRISEALSINKDDVINSSGFISVCGKGKKVRAVPLIKNIKDLLLEYIDSVEITNSDALFINKYGERLAATSVQKLLQKSRRLLGLSETVTPHALRHSCATHLMENGGDLRSVQELLGHSSISSTQIYTDVAKKYISEVYDSCHPLARKRK